LDDMWFLRRLLLRDREDLLYGKEVLAWLAVRIVIVTDLGLQVLRPRQHY